MKPRIRTTAISFFVIMMTSLGGFSQSKSNMKTCVLNYCENTQLEVSALKTAGFIEVKQGLIKSYDILSYRITILLRDDIIIKEVTGSVIPIETKLLLNSLEPASEVRFSNIRIKEKPGTNSLAPDLVFKIY